MINSFDLETPTGSNVYSKFECKKDTTPTGSNKTQHSFFYKHVIPSGFYLMNNL